MSVREFCEVAWRSDAPSTTPGSPSLSLSCLSVCRGEVIPFTFYVRDRAVAWDYTSFCLVRVSCLSFTSAHACLRCSGEMVACDGWGVCTITLPIYHPTGPHFIWSTTFFNKLVVHFSLYVFFTCRLQYKNKHQMKNVP